MKKLIISLACALVGFLGASAQMLIGKPQPSTSLWVDFGTGFHIGSADYVDWGWNGVGFDLGLRLNQAIKNGFSWDVKAKAQTDSDYFTEMLSLQGLTGCRYTSPAVLGRSSVYGAVALGYAYFPDTQDGGFDVDASAGVCFSKHFSLGVCYNYIVNVLNGHLGYASLRFGVRF